MDSERKRNIVYGTDEEDPSTGAVVGSQVGLAASSSYDHSHSGVGRQAPRSVSGEARRLLRSADG